jgi:hypothetical protein
MVGLLLWIRDPRPRVVRLASDAELGRDDHLIAPALDGFAHQLLIGERPIDVGGIEKIDAELDCAVDGRNRLTVVAGAIKLRHAHATEADDGDLEPCTSQFARSLHFVNPSLGFGC